MKSLTPFWFTVSVLIFAAQLVLFLLLLVLVIQERKLDVGYVVIFTVMLSSLVMSARGIQRDMDKTTRSQ